MLTTKRVFIVGGANSHDEINVGEQALLANNTPIGVHTRHQLQQSHALTRSTQRAQTSAEHGNPEDPDFGLWTPGSEA